MEDIFNAIANIIRPIKSAGQLHYGVQLPEQLQTATVFTIFLEKGHKIKVDNGIIVNCDTTPTHEVNYFIGLGGGEFECHLTDLITGEKLIVRI